jgi:hypothetical protein
MRATKVTQPTEVMEGLRCLAEEIGYEVVVQPGPMNAVAVVVWEIATVSVNARFPIERQAVGPEARSSSAQMPAAAVSTTCACWRWRSPASGTASIRRRLSRRTSRAGDPQLHTHAVVANTTHAEGSATSLDGRALYAHARTAGFLYQAALRKNLTETLGVEWEPVHNGVAEISGIDDEVLKHFSRRSQEIRERLARLGARSAHAAEVAALETRKAKDYNVPTHRLREEWRARASELGLDRQALDLVLDRRGPSPALQPDLRAAAEDLATPGGVTENASTFDRRDVLRDWAEAHREGASVARIETLADRWLASPHAVQLEHVRGREHLGGARHSTPEMLALEDRVLTDATARQNTGVASIDESKINDLLASRLDFAGEQATMARALTTSGDGVQVIRAAAGTGKTRGLTVARDAWEAESVRVFGCALAARAAVEMETLAGIDSTTIARMLVDIDQGNGLAPGSVLVVDEAGMVGSRTIDRLAQHAAETGSKLVLVGDDRQLPEIDAGGAFRRLARELGAIELHQVHRQREMWDRDALAQLRQGKVREWSDAYRDHGRLVARPTSDELRETLVDDWWEAARRPDSGDAIMIAHRRSDVAELNALARDRMHRDGRLGDEELVTGTRAFAVGDRVIARRNDRRAGVVNGTRAEVVGVDLERRSVSLRTADGTGRELDSSYLDDAWLDHAYALTAHAAQGATVDQSFVLGSDELYREWGYTALSRHRAQARFYVVSPGSVERALPGLEPEHDAVGEDLVAMLSPSRRKELALDLLDRAGAGAAERTLREARAEIDRAEERIAAMRAEREALGRLQRGRRSAIDEDITRQQEAIERWSVQAAATSDASLPTRADREPAISMTKADLHETRITLVGRGPALGERPSSFAAREAWAREAAQLVGTGTATLDPAPEPASMDDLGIDL